MCFYQCLSGNINHESFTKIFNKMRKLIPYPVHKECPSISLSKSIINKTNNGTKIPIPVEEIKDEWSNLFNNS